MVILAAVALAARGAAAQGRPHLQVLNDIPESQLFMVMNAVASSLGVDCAHCHVRDASVNPNSVVGGWQFDRDDKPAKAKGLAMMRMVREVNASQYGGRPTVTCFTCHRGNLQTSRLEPLPPNQPSGASSTPAVALPSAPAVLQQYITAVGGADAADRFATIVIEGRDERSEGRRGEVTISFKGRDRFRVDFRSPPQPAVAQGFAAAAGWTATGADARALAAADVARLRRVATRYAPLKVAEAVEALRVDRRESIGSRDTYALETIVDANTTRTYFFDVSTGLLLRESTVTSTRLVPLQEQVDYDDYRSVDGIMLPFVVRTSSDAPYDTAVRTFTRIAPNVPLDDALFVGPKARVP
jgi:hypothetical protein